MSDYEKKYLLKKRIGSIFSVIFIAIIFAIFFAVGLLVAFLIDFLLGHIPLVTPFVIICLIWWTIIVFHGFIEMSTEEIKKDHIKERKDQLIKEMSSCFMYITKSIDYNSFAIDELEKIRKEVLNFSSGSKKHLYHELKEYEHEIALIEDNFHKKICKIEGNIGQLKNDRKILESKKNKLSKEINIDNIVKNEIKDHHKRFNANYKFNVKLHFSDLTNGTLGEYHIEENSIYIDLKQIKKYTKNEKEYIIESLDTFRHEYQHAIQYLFGFIDFNEEQEINYWNRDSEKDSRNFGGSFGYIIGSRLYDNCKNVKKNIKSIDDEIKQIDNKIRNNENIKSNIINEMYNAKEEYKQSVSYYDNKKEIIKKYFEEHKNELSFIERS